DDPALAQDLEIVVVVDGSVDGSLEMLEAIDLPIPLKVVWQRNRGRAAARNTGLELANGEIVWFLDDDMVPLPGVLRHHRLAHGHDDAHVVMGPCLLAATRDAIAPNRRWLEQVQAEMASSGAVARADRFDSGNASGPADVFRSVGGFDEGFTGWGCED